jgi:hypothetical protein
MLCSVRVCGSSDYDPIVHYTCALLGASSDDVALFTTRALLRVSHRQTNSRVKPLDLGDMTLG